MKYSASYLKSRYNRDPIQVDIDFKDMILYPLKGYSKDELPMFNFWINPISKRHHSNCTHITGLILDIDGGWTINECVAELSHLHFYLYSSSSHTEEYHKFRFILPFSTPIYRSEYTSDTINGLKKIFPKVDPSSFSPDHMFYFPSNTDSYYIQFNQEGKYFDSIIDLNQLTKMEEKIRIKRESIPTCNISEIIRKQQLDNDVDESDVIQFINNMEYKTESEIKDIISLPDNSGRFNMLVSAIGRGKKRGVSSEKLISFLNGYHKQKELKSLCRK